MTRDLRRKPSRAPRTIVAPSLPAARIKRIGVLIFPDCQLLDATGPIAAYEIAGRAPRAALTVELFASKRGPVRTSSGVALYAHGLERASRLDTLIVAGGQGIGAACADKRALAFIARTARRGSRVASVCTGTYLLAAAGLLDGRRATTHWQQTRHFRSLHPQVRLDPDRVYVKDGQIWSSAGISAGIDLSLAMIAEDFGEEVARDTARQLVFYYRRPGGQSQFATLIDVTASEGRFDKLLAWARSNLDRRLSVEMLAEQVHMSDRNFARAFLKETGVTPGKAIERLRLDVAREHLATAQSVEAVAGRAGFGNAERMRRAFIRVFGQPPQAFRRGSAGVGSTSYRALSAPHSTC
jgi:transcriptional regulator GlxA family with amidase domain